MTGLLDAIWSMFRAMYSRTPSPSTKAGRSHDRYRRAGRTAIASMATRLINIAVGLITIPITIKYLGPDRYGLWMVLSSFVAFMIFTDMGLGIGLQNALAECHGRDDHQAPRQYISSAMVVMSGTFLTLMAVAVFVLPLVPLEELIKVESDMARRELLPTAQSMLIAFGFGLPAGMVQRIFNAYQRGYWGQIWLGVGRLVALGGVLVCVWFRLGLPWLAAAVMGLPFVVLLISSIQLFAVQPWLRPSLGSVRRSAIRRIFGTGMVAMVLQVFVGLVNLGPALIIANRLTAADVTPFSVTQKLVGSASILLSTVLMPLWPAYGEAAVRGDWDWVRRTYRRTLRLGVLVGLIGFAAGMLVGRPVIRVWTGSAQAVPDLSLLAAVCTWFVLNAWNYVHMIALNGLDRMKWQALYSAITTSVAFVVAWNLAPRYGAAGVVWAVVAIGMVSYGICSWVEVVRAIRQKGCSVTLHVPAGQPLTAPEDGN